MMKNLEELCQDLDIDTKLDKTDKGTYLLPLTGDLQIEVGAHDPGVFFYSPLKSCPEVKREELLIYLMKANLFGQGTLDAAIGYDEKENLLTLSLDIPYEMGYRAFKERVEDFANIVAYWRDEIDLHVQKAQEDIL